MPMSHKQLQSQLAARGYYKGAIDGLFQSVSKAACIACLTDGPDYPLTDADFILAANELGVEPYKVEAIAKVESSGNPFVNGIATILFEPHIFSRLTEHRYDKIAPNLSSRYWNRKLYPGSQKGRWQQLMDAVAIDVDAGFSAASYGAFQVLGLHYRLVDAFSPWSFAWRQCQTEGDQLDAFIGFVKGNGLIKALQQARPGDADSCIPFVRAYNGTAFRENNYHIKFAQALLALSTRR